MAIKLIKNSPNIIPEGTYIFRVDSVEFKEALGRLVIKFVTKDGQTYTEWINMIQDGDYNEGRVRWMSFLVSIILQDNNIESLDNKVAKQLVGKYLRADIEHYISSNDKTYPNLKNIEKANGFDEEGFEEDGVPFETNEEEDGVDLDSLLENLA